jgi:hypothetical protein
MKKRRGPRQTADQVLSVPAVKALRETILAARVATGSTDVTQAEVDQGAEALLRAGLPPYPTLLGVVVGGSLSTVGPKLRDWWRRLGPQFLGANTTGVAPETKLDRQLRLLVSQLEATLRERLQGATDPLQALLAAAQLGEQQGLKAQLESAMADRDRLRQQLEAMTFKVGNLEAQLKAHAAARLTEQSALELSFERLQTSLEHLGTQLGPASQRSDMDVDQLTTQVRRLVSRLTRSQGSPRPRTRRRASKTSRKPHKRPVLISRSSAHGKAPGRNRRSGRETSPQHARKREPLSARRRPPPPHSRR